MKKIKLFIVIICLFVLCGCTKQNENEDNKKDDELKEVSKYNINYDIDGEIATITYSGDTSSIYLTHPEKEGYDFLGWYKDGELFDFSTPITSDITLKAKFEKKKVKVTYDFGYDCYQTKAELRLSFYRDFYNFLVSKEAPELEQENISNFEDFMEFMLTWQIYENRSDLYHTGDSFKKYYIYNEPGGKLEDQPDTYFIGWCYKNNKYVEFINFLATFFEYWRTDEGYTSSSGDPNGNDFYADSWSSLVDTAKFFYFTSDTLNTKYAWFNSERVKDALDNIPGVGYTTLEFESDIFITLPTDVKREGYQFIGWYDDNGQRIYNVKKSATVHAKWINGKIIDDLANEFMNDFNLISGRNLNVSQFDTRYLDSSEFVRMVEDDNLNKKWLWLYELIATLAEDETKDPNQEGFSWNDNKSFYITNLCGLFTFTKHKDTNFLTTSLDYSNPDVIDKVVIAIENHKK